MKRQQDTGQWLIELAYRCRQDPLAYVVAAFPWGEPGEVEAHEGPDTWQRDVLQAVGSGLLTFDEAIRVAISAGNGPGKSALICWLILWALATKRDTRGVVTSNTETQLRTKTWAEMGKWYRLCVHRDWFRLNASSICSVDPEHERTWRVDAVPWSEKTVESFAGLHNAGIRLIVVFDEASAIPDEIWRTTEGALTDKHTEIIWVVGGNPTRNTGRFRECFGRMAHRWRTWCIDTRESRLTNQEQIAKWIADYGEDSDYVRVHVKGEFPRAGSMQFIGGDLVDEAMRREAAAGIYDPLVIGVDVARFGDDQTVIYIRRGRDGRTHAPLKLRGLDTMQVAARVADCYMKFQADAVFVDGGGVGAGVVDRLRQLRIPVHDVQFGARADRITFGEEIAGYANKRAEMWGNMREWLKGGAIPEDPAMHAQLTGLEYSFVQRQGSDVILLESKEDMKRRGLESPDIVDALALTFAYPVNAKNDRESAQRNRVISDWDPFNDQPPGPKRSVWNPYSGRPEAHEIIVGDYDPINGPSA